MGCVGQSMKGEVVVRDGCSRPSKAEHETLILVPPSQSSLRSLTLGRHTRKYIRSPWKNLRDGESLIRWRIVST